MSAPGLPHSSQRRAWATDPHPVPALRTEREGRGTPMCSCSRQPQSLGHPPSSPPESGTGSAPADGKAAPHPGAANTQNPRLREKLSERPQQPEYLGPVTHPLPDRGPSPPRNVSTTHSARRLDRGLTGWRFWDTSFCPPWDSSPVHVGAVPRLSLLFGPPPPQRHRDL